MVAWVRFQLERAGWSPDLAEEASQEGVCRLLEADGVSHPWTWVLRVASNWLTSQTRKTTTHRRYVAASQHESTYVPRPEQQLHARRLLATWAAEELIVLVDETGASYAASRGVSLTTAKLRRRELRRRGGVDGEERSA